MPTSTRKVTARLRDGQLLPEANTVRLMLKSLRLRAQKDRKLAAQWRKNPRAVLADLGISRNVQTQILIEEGIKVRVSPADNVAIANCYSCSGCCCTSCCISGDARVGGNVSNPG